MNEARARAQAWHASENEPYARAFFADQFETEANFSAHYHNTGPEIWAQTAGRVDAFVSGAGTGGTIAGVAAYLKETAREQNVQEEPLIVVADPPGSGVYNRVKYGVMYSGTEAEGTRRRHQVDTVVEGVGLNRLTRNLELGLPYIDDAVQVTDDEAVRMSRYVAAHDGLFLGSSSAVHLVAAVRVARRLKADRTPPEAEPVQTRIRVSVEDEVAIDDRTRPVVVTILADSGVRHLSKFHNDDAMKKRGLHVSDDISDILGRS